jgi:transcriptional regulator with XRE-family HTH domain
MAGDLYVDLGAAIRERRTAMGLSQAALGERAGLGRTSITMIELGSQAILVHQLLDIAKALKVSPDKLLESIQNKEVAGPGRELFQAAEAHELLSGLENPIRRITR